WEASWQECQPNALGTLGTLDGLLGGLVRIKRIHMARALDSLWPLGPSGRPRGSIPQSPKRSALTTAFSGQRCHWGHFAHGLRRRELWKNARAALRKAICIHEKD